MAEQPAISGISIKRTVRAFREDRRHESIKALIGVLNPLVMSVPAREIRIDETRDAFRTDAFRLGHPVVRYLRPACSFADAVAGVAGIDFPVVIRRDKFIQKDDNHLTDDLHGDVRTACGLATVVDGV